MSTTDRLERTDLTWPTDDREIRMQVVGVEERTAVVGDLLPAHDRAHQLLTRRRTRLCRDFLVGLERGNQALPPPPLTPDGSAAATRSRAMSGPPKRRAACPRRVDDRIPDLQSHRGRDVIVGPPRMERQARNPPAPLRGITHAPEGSRVRRTHAGGTSPSARGPVRRREGARPAPRPAPRTGQGGCSAVRRRGRRGRRASLRAGRPSRRARATARG